MAATDKLQKEFTKTHAPVAPSTTDQTYIARMEATLDAAERAIANASGAPGKPSKKRTALAVSVVIPVYNERDTITEIVERVRAVDVHQEIIIVDDFSLDGTRDVLLELAHEPDVHVLMHGYNRGKGAAL